MARINHYSSADVVQNLLSDAKDRGVLHLVADMHPIGRFIQIKDKTLLNFGTCAYLGLDTHPKVVETAIEYVRKFGVQMPISRAYASSQITESLEEKLSKIYNKPVIVFPSTSAAHISVVPTLVGSDDVVLLDQQVHISVQTAVQLLRQKGTHIDMIRHSNLEMLEYRINELKDKHHHIWYMVDGVYSMYGDAAPLKEIIALLDKYPQLYLYIDDAHGMSWEGKNGGGFVFGEVPIHEKMMLMSTLGKGFGAIGGIAIFPNKETHWKVRVWGGPLTYSHPHSPAILGAAHASADIHLSDEIIVLQKDIQSKIKYCHTLLMEKNLPILSDPRIPIKFIGAGQPKTGYNLIKGVIDDGFFVNIGIFPGVPIKNTGMRFTISTNVEYTDIEKMVDSIEYNYYKALEKDQISDNEVRKAFRLPINEKVIGNNYKCEVYSSINQINQSEWDKLFRNRGIFDYDGMRFLEKSFTNNSKKEENNTFYYLLKRDNKGVIQMATFFTVGIQKDDFLEKESISMQIEEKRKSEPYFLCSKVVSMGSLLTLGEHLYINKNSKDWKRYLIDLISDIETIRNFENANVVVLRDFLLADSELNQFFIEQGFVQIEMPNTNLVEINNWNNKEEFYAQLSKKNKQNFKKDVKEYINDYHVIIKDALTDIELDHAYNLYLQVCKKNFAINLFPYPESALKAMNSSPNWEFLILSLKDSPNTPVSYCMSYKSGEKYFPVFMGIDYNCDKKPYKQNMFQVLLRAKELGYNYVELGVSANIEKRKVGAKQEKICMYTQIIDNYNMEVIASMGC